MDVLDALYSDVAKRRPRGWKPAGPPAVSTVPEDRAVCRFPTGPKTKGIVRTVASDNSPESTAATMSGLLSAISENRDREAFRDLFDHFAPRIKGFFNRQGANPDLSEEVVQETFVNIWKKAHLFDPEKASASTWIFAIARNTRIDLFRRANRPAPDLNDPALVADPEPSAHQLIARDEEAVRLKKAIGLLPAEQHEVLRLAFFEEKTHAEVAEQLGLPLGTVKSRIRLALRRMRSELGESR